MDICRRLLCAGRLGPQIHMHTIVSRTMLSHLRRLYNPVDRYLSSHLRWEGEGEGVGWFCIGACIYFGGVITRVKS